MKHGYSAFEHRYFAATGKDPYAIEQTYIPMPYSEIRYCRPSEDPSDPPAPPTEAAHTFSNYWRHGLDEAYRLRNR